MGVFAGLVHGRQVALLDARLYLPKEWVEAPARCAEAGISVAQRVLRSTSELALTMAVEARANGVRFAWLVADAGYGKESDFLRRADDADLRFVVDVHKSPRSYLHDPAPEVRVRTPASGRPPTDQHTDHGAAWAAAQSSQTWQTVTVRHAATGELRVEALRQRVWFRNHVEAQARAWTVLAIREIDNPQKIHDAVSNVPADLPPERLVHVQRQRFWIEHAFHEAKSNAGRANYHVRTWNGWHRHMTLCSLALVFLVNERSNHQDDLPFLSARDLRDLIAANLPHRQDTPDDTDDTDDSRTTARKGIRRSRIIQTFRTPRVSAGGVFSFHHSGPS